MNAISPDRTAALSAAAAASHPIFLAMNLGIGRAALQAGRRVPPSSGCRAPGASSSTRRSPRSWPMRPSGSKVARAILWHAAWRSIIRASAPIAASSTCRSTAVAKVFTSEAVYRATEEAPSASAAPASCSDMPLPKVPPRRAHLPAFQGQQHVARFRIAERSPASPGPVSRPPHRHEGDLMTCSYLKNPDKGAVRKAKTDRINRMV